MEFGSSMRDSSAMRGGGGGGGGGRGGGRGGGSVDADECASTTPFNALKDAFSAHLVLPDVVNRLPDAKLQLAYDNASIELGNLIAPQNADRRPIVNFSEFNEKAFYTLIMTDPDVPNRAMPTEREYLHWMAVNITANCLDKGELIARYEPPLPKRGSGLHRYVFVLLEQSAPIVFDVADLRKANSPAHMSSAKFAENARLEKPPNALGGAAPLLANKSMGAGVVERARPRSTAAGRPALEQPWQQQRDADDESNFYGASTKTTNYANETNYGGSAQKAQSRGVTDAYQSPIAQKEGGKKGGAAAAYQPQKDRNGYDKAPLKSQRNDHDAWPNASLAAESVAGDKRAVIGFSDQKYRPPPSNQSSGEDSATNARRAKRSDDVGAASAQPLASVLKTASPAAAAAAAAASSDIQRTGFSTKAFMTKYMIRSVAAGNFFQTEYNDYVGDRLNSSCYSAAGDKSRDNSAKSARDNSTSRKCGSGGENAFTPSVKFVGNTFVKKESVPTSASLPSRAVPATTVKTLEKKLERTALSRK